MALSVNQSRFVCVIFLAALTSCSHKKDDASTNSLAQKGKVIYLAHCIACHNVNPKIAGGLGPEIFGSSLNLLQMRITRGQYPSDYKPKRTTKQMIPMPQISADEILALHAYLNP